MKKLILIILTVMFTGSLEMVKAQDSPTNKLFERYNGKDGFTTVSISKDLFSLFANVNSDDPDAKEMKDMMSKLDGIRVLMLEKKDGVDQNTYDNFKNELSKIKTDNYSDLMTVKESGQEVKFLVKKKGENIGELLLLINSGDEVGFVSITGDIDMNTIGKLSKSMNFEGMQNLQKLDEEDK
jgi:hypothetical protein